ncbi:MAG: NAD(P)H-hydrate dehydratase [Clostridia bacterium]|nr:NAD(P)H-hydrate dehydratase [Clostridia bacterium]
MERILTNSQMRDADKYTIDKLGISSEELVERAGLAVADEINRRFLGGRILVCIGNGNNGADGQVVAKLLSTRHGFTVNTINVSNGIFKAFEKEYDIIVDCIFGTGLNREVEGKYKKAIELINASNAFVVSCDIPSGLNGDTGIPMGIAVKSNLTIAIQEFKLGHFINDGPDYCGEVIAKDIGISIWGDDYVTRLSKSFVKTFFDERKRNVHKGNFGKACVFGGSKSFPGSVLLSLNALTTLKMGVGYSNIAFPETIYKSVAGIIPECTVTPIKDENGNVVFAEESLKNIIKNNAISFGMGIGVSIEVYKALEYLLKNYKGNLLIDADGLNTLAEYGLDILKSASCNIVVSPHIGEFSRLTKRSKQEILSNEIEIAKGFAKQYNVVVVLKSSSSIITDGEKVVLNTTGCSGLAKGGSGDVLSGVICGLLARCENHFDAACVGPYIFGLAGEFAQKEQNEYSITATDVINNIYKAIDFVRD